MGQGAQGLHRSDQHLAIDGVGADVQRAAKDERKTQHIVHLIGIIRAAGRHDQVLAHGVGELGTDLGFRIGQREHNGFCGHRGDHGFVHQLAGGDPDKDIGILHGRAQRVFVRGACEPAFVGIEVLALVVQHAAAVDHKQIPGIGAKLDQQLHGGDTGGARAEAHDARLSELLALQIQRIAQAGADDHGGAVLVVMKDGDVEPLLQCLLDLKTFRRRNVFKIDAPEGRGDVRYGVDEVLCTGGVDFDVKDIDVREVLEQYRLAFQNRFAGQRAHIAQTQYGAAVGDDSDQIAFVGVTVNGGRIGGNGDHRFGDTGRVGQCQLILGGARFGGGDAEFAGQRQGVIIKRGLFAVLVHGRIRLFYLSRSVSSKCVTRFDLFQHRGVPHAHAQHIAIDSQPATGHDLRIEQPLGPAGKMAPVFAWHHYRHLWREREVKVIAARPGLGNAPTDPAKAGLRLAETVRRNGDIVGMAPDSQRLASCRGLRPPVAREVLQIRRNHHQETVPPLQQHFLQRAPIGEKHMCQHASVAVMGFLSGDQENRFVPRDQRHERGVRFPCQWFIRGASFAQLRGIDADQAHMAPVVQDQGIAVERPCYPHRRAGRGVCSRRGSCGSAWTKPDGQPKQKGAP